MKPLLLATGLLLATELPAQYGNPARTWAFLAGKYDADGDGAIRKDEYPRGKRAFDHLDSDGDAVLTRRDCETGRQFRLQQAIAVQADADHDLTVTPAEWKALWSELQPGEDGAYDIQEFLVQIHWDRQRTGRRRGGGGGAGRGGGRGGHRRQRQQAVQYALDMDGDDLVKAADLAQLFAWLDADGDGALTREEVRDSHDVVRRPLPTPLDPDSGPAAGTQAPDFELREAGDPEKRVHLSELCGEKPVVLVFGSYSDPGLRQNAPRLADMQRTHGDDVRFLLVYVREVLAIDSHPSSGFQLIEDPIADEERTTLARRCVTALELPFPAVVDGIDDSVGEAYRAGPLRCFLVGEDREILFAGRAGNQGFDAGDLEDAIAKAAAGKRRKDSRHEAPE